MKTNQENSTKINNTQFKVLKDNIDITNDLRSLGVQIESNNTTSKNNYQFFGITKNNNNLLQHYKDAHIVKAYMKTNFPAHSFKVAKFNDCTTIQLDKVPSCIFEKGNKILAYGSRNAQYLMHDNINNKAIIQYEKTGDREHINYANIQKHLCLDDIKLDITHFLSKVNVPSAMGGDFTYDYMGKNENKKHCFKINAHKDYVSENNKYIKGNDLEICSFVFNNNIVAQYDYMLNKSKDSFPDINDFKIGIQSNKKTYFFDDTAKEISLQINKPLHLKQNRVCLSLTQDELKQYNTSKIAKIFIVKGLDEIQLDKSIPKHDISQALSDIQKPENINNEKIRSLVEEAVKTGHIIKSSHTQFEISKKGVDELFDHKKMVQNIQLSSIKKEYGGGYGIYAKLKFNNGHLHDFKMKANKNDMAIINSLSNLNYKDRRNTIASVISQRMQFGYQNIPTQKITNQKKDNNKLSM